MKKFLVLVILVFCVNSMFAQNQVGLDVGIEDAANFLSERIPAGTSVAVFNFTSDSEKLSVYIVDELTIALTNTGMDVFDRNNLDEVNREIYYGFTGAVNDDTAQSYGKDVGVNTVILGSIIKSGDSEYRLRVQAIIVETKRVQAGRTFNIRQDERLLSLLDIRIQNEYRFTNAEKTSAGFKNMLFGWGSFKMGDPLGGGVTIALELPSLVAIFIGIQPLLSSDGESIFWSESYSGSWNEQDTKLRRLHTTLAVAGVGVLVLSWTWGFIRPHIYDKPVAVRKIANAIEHLSIGVVPMNNGSAKIAASLNYSFLKL
jgi:hypothetical protein